jgi:cytochrome c oxidase subunit 2
MSAPAAPDGDVDRGERTEHRWAVVMVVIELFLVAIAVVTGVQLASMPQSHVETIDPLTLHLHGEFIDSNLGTAVEPGGDVVVRGIGQQYSFTPDCILVPTDTPITFRLTSADVVHGLLVTGTDINLMLVPGYVSNIPARFTTPGDRLMPCQEFCGAGHEGMWARVRVVDKTTFAGMAATARRLSCVE